MKRKTIMISCLLATAFVCGAVGQIKGSVATADTAVSEATLVQNYYQRLTLQKDGTETDSLSFGGLVPYGSGEISLGTYDMTATSDLTAPLFTVLPQKEWKSTATPTASSDEMFFNVNLSSGEKSITFRFARATGSNYTAIFVGTNGNYVAGNNNNVWSNSTEWPYTGLPYRYDGTVSSTSIYDETKTAITKPLDIGLYYRSGQYGGEFYTDATGQKGATNASVAKETETGSGKYRYILTLATSFSKFTADELKNMEVSIDFDKDTVTKDEAWVMFTSIGGKTFTHDINYEPWGGVIEDSDYTKSYALVDTAIPKLPTQITKDNYTFSHWYYGTNPDNKVNESGFSQWLLEQTGDITLNAYYIPEEFKVQYNLNYSGAPTMQADTINYINYYGFDLKEVDTEDYPQGMIFDGWYTQATGGVKITEISELADTTVYARWTAGHLVSFDDGENQTTVPVKAGESVSAPTAPEKAGYTFTGWTYNDAPYDFTSAVSADMTIQATYTLNNYTLAYYIDGEKVDERTGTYLQTLGMLPNIPEKDGYTGGVWYCGNQAVTADTQIQNDMVIVAVYAKKSYAVTFQTAGGSEVQAISVVHGEQIDGNEITVSKTGYEFVEWQCNGKKFDFSTPVTSNLTLTAVWEIKTYQISVMQNGEELAVITKNYGDKVFLQEIATATGKKVNRVYLDGSLSEIYDVETLITAHQTVYLPYTQSSSNTNWIIWLCVGAGVVVVGGFVTAFILINKKKGVQQDEE